MTGILAHGYALTNQLQYHDDIVEAFDVGSTFRLGRWSNEILNKSLKMLFGGDVVSMSLFNGVLALLIFAFTALIIVKVLDIKSEFLGAVIGGIMVVFPSVVSIFGYRFMAYTYALAFFLGALGVYLVVDCKINKVVTSILFIFIETFAVGIYQAVIPFVLSLIALCFFTKCLTNDISWKDFIKNAFIWAVLCFCFLASYLLIAKVTQRVTNIQPTEYQGYSQVGNTSLLEYLQRIIVAYKMSIIPPLNSNGDMYPMSIRFLFYVVLISSIALTAYLIIVKKNINLSGRAQSLIVAVIIPLAINFIYVMCSTKTTTIYSLMEYSQVYVFIYFVVVLELTVGENGNVAFKDAKIFTKMAVCLLAFTCFLYVRYANLCYTKAEYIQTRAISYMSVLQARIQGTEGYKESYSVVFANANSKSLASIADTTQLDNIYIPPYSASTLVNNYAWHLFMSMWNGYSPVIQDVESLPEPDIVESMPHYPDDGSIQIIGEVVVVNF